MELLRSGKFALVSNPFFTALLITATGLFLLASTPLPLTAPVMLFVAVQEQVGTVGQPYLIAKHGDAYRDYIRSVGRLRPGIGTLI